MQNLEKLDTQINWRQPDQTRTYELKLERFGTIYVDHETYNNYMHTFWNEWKEKILGSRCRIKSEKGNFFKRCDKDCSECEFYKSHHRTGRILSLDQLYLDNEFEVESENLDIVESLCIEERKEIIWAAVAELDEIDQIIIKGFSEGVSDSKLAKQIEEEKKVKLTQQAVNKRKIKCFSILKEKLEKFDIFF